MTASEVFAWIQAHPWTTAAVATYLLLCVLGNAKLDESIAVAYPRLASAWVVGQKIGAVGRGLLKPVVGMVLPSAAKDVVSQLFPGAFAGPATPRNTGEEHPS